MSTFAVSDLVVAKCTVQGLQQGKTYEVVAVTHSSMGMFGEFYSYQVQAVGEEPLWIANGPVVLALKEPIKAPVGPGYSGPCGSGWTGDRCTKKLGHKGKHSNE